MRFENLVLVTVLVMVALAGCSQSEAPKESSPTPQPSGGGSVPVYSGSNLYSAPSFYYQVIGIPTEGVSIQVYFVENANIRDVLNWYKEKLSDYEVVQDIAITTVNTPQGSAEWGGVLFKKGDEAIGVWAISGSGVEEGKGVIYYLVKGPAGKITGEYEGGTTEAEQLPSSDQASGDEPVNRYPNSVMLNYYKDTSNPMKLSIQIDYGTKDSAQKVSEWYKNEMKSKGWTLEEESSDDSAYYLAFSKGEEYLDLAIIKPTDTTAYTEIDMSYSKEGLPSSDLVQGEEPMKRYPNSVMLEYTQATYGGAKMLAITYGTSDEPDKVFDWYKNELMSDGWQIFTSSSGETFTIGAYKGSSAIELEISKKRAYTEILITFTGQS